MIADDMPTYAGVARWLPDDIRESIEQSAPCIGDRPHEWHHDQIEVNRWGQKAPERVLGWWECSRCGITASTEPES